METGSRDFLGPFSLPCDWKKAGIPGRLKLPLERKDVLLSSNKGCHSENVSQETSTPLVPTICPRETENHSTVQRRIHARQQCDGPRRPLRPSLAARHPAQIPDGGNRHRKLNQPLCPSGHEHLARQIRLESACTVRPAGKFKVRQRRQWSSKC